MYFKKTFLIVITLFLAFSCKEASKEAEPIKDIESTENKESNNSDDWVDYKSDDLAFTAKFPKAPKRTLQKVPSAIGELDLHIIMDSSLNEAFAVMRSDYPEEMFKDATEEFIKTVLDGAVNGAVTNVGGTLISDDEITFKGYMGRSIKVETKFGYLYIKSYLVKNIMYINQVILPIKNDGSPKIEKFFNAFDIVI